MVCALTYGGEAPIVITGANRPGSAPGADGPANLLDAIILARAPAAAGLGVVVAFGGEVHAATTVRKIDSTGPAAFGSPAAGPLGRIVEGRVWLHATPRRPAPMPVRRLDHRVATVTTGAGRRRRDARHAARTSRRRGAGRARRRASARRRCSRALRAATERVPVLITCRPDRSSMLFSTYGFEGAERDLRASGAICVPFLSPAAARIALAVRARGRPRPRRHRDRAGAVRRAVAGASCGQILSSVRSFLTHSRRDRIGSPAMGERTKYAPGTFSWTDLATTDQDGAQAVLQPAVRLGQPLTTPSATAWSTR